MVWLILTIGVLTIAAGLVAWGMVRIRDKRWERVFEEEKRRSREKIMDSFRITCIDPAFETRRSELASSVSYLVERLRKDQAQAIEQRDDE